MLLVAQSPHRFKRMLCIAAAAIALCASACGGESQSRIEQGQPVVTGNADFDSFFKEVDALRQASSKAVSEADSLSSPLSKSLGVPGSANSDDALLPLSERAKKWRDSGFKPSLSLTPAPTVEKQGKPSSDASDDTVLEAVEASAKDALSLAERMRDLERRAAAMRAKAKELKARVRVTFGSKADDIETELSAATVVLERASELSAAQGGRASYFVVGMMSALEKLSSGLSAPSKPSTASNAAKPPARPPAGRKPPNPKPPPASTSGAATSKPAGKPPSSDFDP